MDFHVLKTAVAKRFAELAKHTLFRANTTELDETGADKDVLYKTYLGAFREGDNPIYRERTQHECSCCRAFIRTVGSAVAIVDGKIETIWDVKIDSEPGYQHVADVLAQHVRSKGIADLFLHYQRPVGQDKSFEEIVEGGKTKTKTWEHFFVNLPATAVAPKDTIPTRLGDMRESKNVFLRGMSEIGVDITETVLELIGQNSLYRGEEHKRSLTAYLALQKKFAKLKTDAAKDLFAWEQATITHPGITRLRNTSIGTLLVDLAKGVELEDAVKSFESKVAPTNYKRPTALVTKAMVEKAKVEVEKLGLTSALQRRFACLEDVSVNDVLFADRNARKAMQDSVFDDLGTSTATTAKDFAKVETINIDKFLSDVLPGANVQPGATSLEILFENKHASNLVSLVAPVDPTAGKLFKWDNGFSWAYAGDLTDSIKARVKAAGGNVTGDVCCRLAWYNHDDLDIHMKEPGGYEIYFANRGRNSPNGGQQDVDMNAGGGTTRTPVENIFYQSKNEMSPGTYRLAVHQWARRESHDVGFEVEIDILGEVTTFSYEKGVKDSALIEVAQIVVGRNGSIELKSELPSTTRSKTIWGLQTQQFQRVNLVSLSPNYWSGEGVGNKHYMFLLADCVREDTARGFFNEFLRSDLDKHRKVLEMVGSKVKTEANDHQLSGLGFSSTQSAEFVVRVTGKTTRVLKVRI